MSTNRIKIIDPSQIKYTPLEGEVIQSSIDKKFYAYKDKNWILIDMENSGIQMGLYDINKQIISQLPILTNLEDKKYTIYSLHAKFNNEFYMLYGKEISYFTLFKIFDAIYFGDEVINCLNNIGDIKAIDFTESKDAIEIWVQNAEGPTCLYLFPYDMGLVRVGE